MTSQCHKSSSMKDRRSCACSACIDVLVDAPIKGCKVSTSGRSFVLKLNPGAYDVSWTRNKNNPLQIRVNSSREFAPPRHPEQLYYLHRTHRSLRHSKQTIRLAEAKKNEGNEKYKSKEYREAEQFYSQAIELCPECAAFYSNRSACYMMLGKYLEALTDARTSVQLDADFVKGYLRVAKCNIALGDANAALSVLRRAADLEPSKAIRDEVSNAEALLRCTQEIAKCALKQDYRAAVYHIDRASRLAVGSRALKLQKAECFLYLSKYPEAEEIANTVLLVDSTSVDAIFVRGMCLYHQENQEQALVHFQHVLRLAPDHKKAQEAYKKCKLLKQKKDAGNEAFRQGDFKTAGTLYTEALTIDPSNKKINAKIYSNRATVHFKRGKYEEAIEDCTQAINVDQDYVKALTRRATCYQKVEKHEEAVRDLDKVYRLNPSYEHKAQLAESKRMLKMSKRKDYYKILGIGKTASIDEVKKAYRKKALLHHPDRHADATVEDKDKEEKKFKEIMEAYTVLSDSKKKSIYDQGGDLDGMGAKDAGNAEFYNTYFDSGLFQSNFGRQQSPFYFHTS